MVRPGLPVLSVVEGYRFGFNGKEMDHEAKGNFAQLDYGFRIYDPRAGRFLSVDPLTAKYPWYTPYQFAGNKPIRFVDTDGMEEAEITKKYLQYSQDMSNVPKTYKSASGRVVTTTYNLHGYGVNSLYFWENNIKQHPEFLDEWNKGRVLQEGRAPVFTNDLKENFTKLGVSTEGLKIGDLLEHHHINQGRTAVPITREEHKKIPVEKNPKEIKISNKPGRISNMAGRATNVMGNVSDITGLLTGDPNALANQFGKNVDIGTLYKNLESELYYTIVSKTDEENGATLRFWIYSESEWDKELKKFVGSNPVGYGESYQEKGFTMTVVYDLHGNVKSYNEKGKKASRSTYQ